MKLNKRKIGWLIALAILMCTPQLMLNFACAEDTDITLLKETKKSIDPYILILGTEANDGNLTVSQEFADGIDKVFLMGNIGTIDYQYISNVIDLMTWRSNENFTKTQFEMFVLSMNKLFGADGLLQSYSNISETTYVWDDSENNCVVLCWLESKSVNVMWYYPEDDSSEKMIIASTEKSTETNSTPIQKSNTKASRYCEVSGCYKEGKYPFSILGRSDEYYCKEHYDEMINIMSKMEEDVGTGKYSKHLCEAGGCNKEGSRSIVGIFGTLEYYCSEHYYEVKKMLELFE